MVDGERLAVARSPSLAVVARKRIARVSPTAGRDGVSGCISSLFACVLFCCHGFEKAGIARGAGRLLALSPPIPVGVGVGVGVGIIIIHKM